MKYIPEINSKEIDKEINEFIKATQLLASENVAKEFKSVLSSYDFESVKALVDETIQSYKGFEGSFEKVRDKIEKISVKSQKIDNSCSSLIYSVGEVGTTTSTIENKVLELYKSIENHQKKSTKDHDSISLILRELMEDSIRTLNLNIETKIKESEKRTNSAILIISFLFTCASLACQYYALFVWQK